MKYGDGLCSGFILGAGCMSLWHGSWFMGKLDSTTQLYVGVVFIALDIFLRKAPK